MAKPLNDILRGVKASKVVPGSTGKDPGVDYAPKAKGDQDFVAKHKTEKHEDRVGNKDDVYKGDTKYVLDRASENRHGYKEGEAEKVYESAGEYFRGSFKRHEVKPLKHTHEFTYRLKGAKVAMKSKHDDEASAKKQRDHFLSKPERYHDVGKIIKVNESIDDSIKEDLDLMTLEEATAKQINDRMDSLMAAKKAEKAGDKKAQYSHMADYHSKYATHSKTNSDIEHHKSQADKYRSAAKAFEEETKCNMTEEGKYCPVHEMADCTKKPLSEVAKEKHFFHVHLPADDVRLHKMVDDNTSEPIGVKSKSHKLKITVPGDRNTATNKAAKYVAKNYGTGVKFTYGGKISESLAFPLLGSRDDDESAEMAKTQLRALANKALALAMHLNDDQIVEPWVQAKIAVAKDNVTAVHDYMIYGDHDKPEDEQTAPYDGGVDMSGAPRNTYPNFSADVNTGRNV